MQCINPLSASYDHEGKITFSKKEASNQFVGFKLPCGKCLACRLNKARDKAIRAVHEAKMHEQNIFLTLTYNDENLKSPKLDYRDFELFMKRLREHESRNSLESDYISFMVTGEYGDRTKRPHWHALLFNYSPDDGKLKYTTDLDHEVFTSEKLRRIWKKGNIEYGSVTMESAGYVARYAAKKLSHGRDGSHDYEPIHNTSKKRAIGRSWIEKYYQHTFDNGFVVLPNGQTAQIPRYYVDWVKKNKPEVFRKYITGIANENKKKAEIKARKEELDFYTTALNAIGSGVSPITRSKVKNTILKSKFKRLQEKLKL